MHMFTGALQHSNELEATNCSVHNSLNILQEYTNNATKVQNKTQFDVNWWSIYSVYHL